MALVIAPACLLFGLMVVLVGFSLFGVAKMIFDEFRNAEGIDRVMLGIVLAILCAFGLTLPGVMCGFVMTLIGKG